MLNQEVVDAKVTELLMVWPRFGLDKSQVDVLVCTYQRACKNFSNEEFITAVDRWISKGNKFPCPADLREIISTHRNSKREPFVAKVEDIKLSDEQIALNKRRSKELIEMLTQKKDGGRK